MTSPRKNSSKAAAGAPPPDANTLDRVAFGKRLRAARKQFGWTLAQVAEQSGVSITTISRAERGQLAEMPVIFLTGHADVPTAVDAVKRGAFDFCEKPFSDNALVDRIEQALVQSQRAIDERRQRQQITRRVVELTEREREVMRRVVAGLPNKLIADELAISVRTVEVHRARVFDKMEVKSAVELANLLRGIDDGA